MDRYAGAMYNGYDSLTHFYTEMSTILPNNATQNRFAIPHLVLSAFDDPITTWRSNAANDPSSPLYPRNLVNEHQDKLVLLLTAKGGHVGWPIGWWPNSWKYMNDYVAAGFVNAYQKTRFDGNQYLSGANETIACSKETRDMENTFSTGMLIPSLK
jgi:predicted alpha/beta-fold hydrolase